MAKESTHEKKDSLEVPGIATGANLISPQKHSWLSRDWLWGLILILAVVLVYSPVWWAGYIWDDNTHLTNNPCIVGPFGLREIWTTKAASIYPLTLTTFWIEHKMWGLAPLPYHLVSVLTQAACAIMLWQVLRSLRVPGAWLGAALWALHPVQVESVAWIAETKNTQSCLFYLLSILFFLKLLKERDAGVRIKSDWNYALTLLFAALAMTSKFSTVVLPMVLCLCTWWLERRWQWRRLLQLAPIFAMSALTAGITLWYGSVAQVLLSERLLRSWPERIVTAGDVFWFYVGKLIWPPPLLAMYPRWQIDASQWISYLPLLAAIILLLVLWLNRKTWARPYLFALAYFLVVLFPFLGFFDQSFWRFSFVEDHLQYLAGMGPLALIGAGMLWLANLYIPTKPWLQYGLCAVLLLTLGIASWQRAWAYQSEETLWTDTLKKNPNCWFGYNHLGAVFDQKGQIDQSILCYRKSVEIKPDNFFGQDALSSELQRKGQFEEAVIHSQKAVELGPDFAEARNNLGLALAQNGQLDEAITQFQNALEMALEIDPKRSDFHNNLGNAFLKAGQVSNAIDEFEMALQINPHNAQAQQNLTLARSILLQ